MGAALSGTGPKWERAYAGPAFPTAHRRHICTGTGTLPQGLPHGCGLLRAAAPTASIRGWWRRGRRAAAPIGIPDGSADGDADGDADTDATAYGWFALPAAPESVPPVQGSLVVRPGGPRDRDARDTGGAAQDAGAGAQMQVHRARALRMMSCAAP